MCGKTAESGAPRTLIQWCPKQIPYHTAFSRQPDPTQAAPAAPPPTSASRMPPAASSAALPASRSCSALSSDVVSQGPAGE